MTDDEEGDPYAEAFYKIVLAGMSKYGAISEDILAELGSTYEHQPEYSEASFTELLEAAANCIRAVLRSSNADDSLLVSGTRWTDRAHRAELIEAAAYIIAAIDKQRIALPGRKPR